jgi:hypothetical protein
VYFKRYSHKYKQFGFSTQIARERLLLFRLLHHGRELKKRLFPTKDWFAFAMRGFPVPLLLAVASQSSIIWHKNPS